VVADLEWKLLSRFLSSGYPDQSQQARAEQPRCGRNWHDIAIMHSPCEKLDAIGASELLAVAEGKTPRVACNWRELGTGPVVVAGLDVTERTRRGSRDAFFPV